MTLYPIAVTNTCIADDATLTAHVHSALARALPVVGQHPVNQDVAVLVGSGPSLDGQLDSIKRQQAKGRPIVAIKDAHDWLLQHGVCPDFAVVIDPTENQWQCFRRKQSPITYFVASQCHPLMFDHLADQRVHVFHLMFNHGKAYPPNTVMIGGCTTTGLRAITLFYTMGFRRVELYGFDSCYLHGHLRVDSAWTRPDETQTPIQIVVGDRTFHCNPGMAAQADEFQHVFTMMPDMFVQSYGDGLLTAILNLRAQRSLYGEYGLRTHGAESASCALAV